MECAGVILAGGWGKRFRSPLPKVLHPLHGKPIVQWVLDSVKNLPLKQIFLVIPSFERIPRKVWEEKVSSPIPITFCEQKEPKGTGDALQSALPFIPPSITHLLILPGDAPCFREETFQSLMDPLSTGKKIRFLTATVEDPQGYGRVIRKGKKIRIVEERDLTPKQREIRRVNGGVYYGPKELFEKGVKTLTTNNAQGEKYLVDILSLYPAEEREVSDPEEILGINTRYDYMRGIKILNRRILKKWMDEGVTILSPETTWVEGDVKLHRDVFLEPGVYLKGKTSVGEESKVGTGSILLDTVVGPRVEIRPYVVAEKATIEESSFIGPFSHLRPNTWIKKGSHIGNFVELKNTIFGPHSKANHLSYLGDAEVGAEVNVGAGTITCNYDGVQKHRTIIEDGVFIGSDTQLVAPVKVGKNAYIGAGTTVTRDVPPESLAISRVPQKEIPNYARRKKLSLKEKR